MSVGPAGQGHLMVNLGDWYMRTFYRGALGYINPNTNEELGREWFSGVHAAGQGMTHQATVQWMLESGSNLKRDVTVTIDNEFLPIDCYNRIEVDGSWRGSAWFLFEETCVSCEAMTEQYGRVHQRMDYQKRPGVFTTHPVTCDAWATAPFDHSLSQQTQRFDRVMHTSPTPNGSTGPLLDVWDLEVSYFGSKQVEVPAGKFDTEYYTFSILSQPDWAPLHVYVFGPRRQLARLYWETLDLNFDLIELEERQL